MTEYEWKDALAVTRGFPDPYGDGSCTPPNARDIVTATIEKEAEKPLGGNLPDLDLSDPAQLEAFYGNFAFFDHYRKSVLAECHEIERAKALESGTKTTETQLENRARLHPNYIDFISTHFKGRHQREQNILQSLRNGS